VRYLDELLRTCKQFGSILTDARFRRAEAGLPAQPLRPSPSPEHHEAGSAPV
jgi:hypothetical protein